MTIVPQSFRTSVKIIFAFSSSLLPVSLYTVDTRRPALGPSSWSDLLVLSLLIWLLILAISHVNFSKNSYAIFVVSRVIHVGHPAKMTFTDFQNHCCIMTVQTDCKKPLVRYPAAPQRKMLGFNTMSLI